MKPQNQTAFRQIVKWNFIFEPLIYSVLGFWLYSFYGLIPALSIAIGNYFIYPLVAHKTSSRKLVGACIIAALMVTALFVLSGVLLLVFNHRDRELHQISRVVGQSVMLSPNVLLGAPLCFLGTKALVFAIAAGTQWLISALSKTTNLHGQSDSTQA